MVEPTEGEVVRFVWSAYITPEKFAGWHVPLNEDRYDDVRLAAVQENPCRKLEAAHAEALLLFHEAVLQACERRARSAWPLINRAEVQHNLLGEAVHELRLVAVALRLHEVQEGAIHER
jgi:hypothetical protein